MVVKKVPLHFPFQEPSLSSLFYFIFISFHIFSFLMFILNTCIKITNKMCVSF